MGRKKGRLRMIGIVTAAVLLVSGLLLAAVLSTIRSGMRSTIILPDGPLPAPPEQEGAPVGDLFIEVERENILRILSAMQRPERYHQVLTVTRFWHGGSSSRTVEIYRSGELAFATISGEGRDRSLLTDGAAVWLWYSDENQVRTLSPDPSVTFDDLTGIPTYEAVAALPLDSIAEAGFVTLDGASCLYVSARGGASEERYWVDASTSLLCRANALEGDQLTYQLRQSLWEVPDEGALQDVFRLPDGTKIGS